MWALNSNNQEFQAQIPISVPDFTDTQPTQNQFGQTVNHEIYAGEFSNKTLHVSFLKKIIIIIISRVFPRADWPLGRGDKKRERGKQTLRLLTTENKLGGRGGYRGDRDRGGHLL